MFLLTFIFSVFSSVGVLASSNPFKIINAIITDKSAGVTGDISGIDNQEVRSNVTFYKLDDNVTYRITIKNNKDRDLLIKSITDNNSNNYVIYSYDRYEDYLLTAGNTFDFDVRVVYKNAIFNSTYRNQSSEVKFTIVYEDDGVEEENTININPNTSDTIHKSVILLFISSLGLIICVSIDKRSRKFRKKMTFVMIGFITVPVIVKAATLSFDVYVESNIGLCDKMIVTYVINGEEYKADTAYNETINQLAAPPAIPGYNFIEWQLEDGTTFDPSNPITKDTTLVAKYELIEYSISYNLDGVLLVNSNRENYYVTDNFNLSNPVKEGYDFVGWTGTDITTPTKNVNINNNTGNRTYTANWVAHEYTITYNGLTDSE